MSNNEVHKYGTDDGWHGVIKSGGQFEPEADRYHMYIGGCHPTIADMKLKRV